MFDWPSIIAIIKDIWWIISMPLMALIGGGMFYLRSQFPTKVQHDEQTKTLQAAISSLSDRVGENERHIEQRVSKIESDLRQLPGRVEMERMGERISRVEKEVATSIETTRGVKETVVKIDHTLSLILKHLLEGKNP
jgi:hypothetical protein